LVYGRSKFLKEGVVGLENCTSYCGQGEVVERFESTPNFHSEQFQWLPCDVHFEGEDDVKIASYINNLHPQENPELYRLIEKIIAKAVPLWDQLLSHTGGALYKNNGTTRSRDYVRPFRPRVEINDFSIEWPHGHERPGGWTLGRHPQTEEEKEELDALVETTDARPDGWWQCNRHDVDEEKGLSDDESWDLDEWWSENISTLHMPEPKPFTPREVPEEPPLDLRREYNDSGLQVIVKLANTCLTPGDPQWDGGSWHVEGLLNEHIVATAIYYFSNDNITPSHLKFRHNCSNKAAYDMDHGQDDWEHLEKITGFKNEHDYLIQNLGSVLCKEGRLLAFPNVLQHNVGSFQLEDHTRDGKRKILALFLVDPHVRICPPQRSPHREKTGGRVSYTSSVFEDVTDFPISMDEAKGIREALMEERGPIAEGMIECEARFCFCEH
ncbi:hypothetical protein KCU68_g15524, partial [Aureobasidium melanogenum]